MAIAGAHPEAVGQVRGAVELAAAHVHGDDEAFRNGTMPGSRRWISAPSARKSTAPVGGILSEAVITKRTVADQSV